MAENSSPRNEERPSDDPVARLVARVREALRYWSAEKTDGDTLCDLVEVGAAIVAACDDGYDFGELDKARDHWITIVARLKGTD